MTPRIHAIHDVKGKDGVGATMDSMELEKERGITIASAATYCEWGDHEINIIDTPGHVDFTIEVERSAAGARRRHSGAVRGGRRAVPVHHRGPADEALPVPCIAFVNKCDRSGANPFRVVAQLREKLGHNAVPCRCRSAWKRILTGVIDLISR
jgi:elongation factor G